jgi:hypothetical protein
VVILTTPLGFGVACAKAPLPVPFYFCFSGQLIDFNLLDALTNAFLAGTIDSSSMQFAIGQHARHVPADSIFRALYHIENRAVAIARVPKKFTDFVHDTKNARTAHLLTLDFP